MKSPNIVNKKSKGVCPMLNENGDISQKVLLSADSDGQQIFRLQFIDGKDIYIISVQKKGFCMNKFSL
ncbi:MAG TPA: hypothetical protein PKK66_04565 [Bacteroidales bacterium]|nr:hypothetical protein [Bacteroidales bacterium]HNW68105.1 hypothetical protein [Bacteroidales bacterium]HPT52573.1 hypothetical protein [Bacteroidales bacterium]